LMAESPDMPGPSLALAHARRGQERGNNASACTLEMRGGAWLVLRSGVSGCDAVRFEDVVDTDKRGMRLNASAVTTMSSVAERRAAGMAMIGTKPAQKTALTCAQKL
jgi:hypothetical protein